MTNGNHACILISGSIPCRDHPCRLTALPRNASSVKPLPTKEENTMESESRIAFPLQAIWIGSSTQTFERTQVLTRPLFSLRFWSTTFALSAQEIAELEPGCPIIIESPDSESPDEGFESFDGIVRKFIQLAESPVILCVGHQIPAEIVVDWMRAGVFSYVEQLADETHFQQAFNATAMQASKMRQQHQRYATLSELWGSISERESSVLDMLMDGLPNKTIANRLGVSQRTIEARRHNLYEKLQSRSVVDVVRLIYEFKSLESIFRRVDGNPVSTTDTLPRAPKFLRPPPIRQRNIVEIPSLDQETLSQKSLDSKTG